MCLITLTTDFGLKDGNVGVMKGVIWGIAPQVQMTDLSHLIPPQDIHQAALILSRSAPYFPAGTIHLVVVDPGVGTARRPMAARLGDQFFVGPDNGVFTLMIERAQKKGETTCFVHLTRPQYWLPEVSHVFHGRDIFAPVAAHLALGVEIQALGSVFDDPVKLVFPEPKRRARGWLGEIIHIDHFGNLSTNLRREHLGDLANVVVRLKGLEIHGLVRTFGERQPGDLVALYGSTGNLIICEVNGNAFRRLGVQVGEPCEVDEIPLDS